MTVYGAVVASQGLGPSHEILIDEVPPGSRVLDIGCAEGYVARELVARGCSVVGVEFDPAAAETAREVCEEVHVGDLESDELRSQVTGEYDRILFGDVLEHLRDGETVLRWTRDLLAPDGRAVISLPNIAHWSARRTVARGRFPRADHGLFDRTHLRFFTRETAEQFVRDSGYEIERERFAAAPLPFEGRLTHLVRLRPAALRVSPELFALQVIMTCRPA